MSILTILKNIGIIILAFDIIITVLMGNKLIQEHLNEKYILNKYKKE